MGTHGGKRNGTGPKKGSKHKKTLEQKIALDTIRQRVLKNAQKLINSQLNLAYGVSYLFKVKTHKNRKEAELINDQDTIMEYFDGSLEKNKKDDEYFYITTEKPSGRALNSLFDRALGKATTSLDVTSGGEIFNVMSYERAKAIIIGERSG